VRKNPFSQKQQLQILAFVHAEFAILVIFGFFLMTTEFAEVFSILFSLRRLRGEFSSWPMQFQPK